LKKYPEKQLVFTVLIILDDQQITFGKLNISSEDYE